MKTFNLAESRKKRNKHIMNIAILTVLYYIGHWIGVRYDQGHSPYMIAYAIPSLAAGLVFCKRFSDKTSAYLHPYTKSRVTVNYYGSDYDPAVGIVGTLLRNVFYILVGFLIFPAYFIWAVLAVVWLTISIYRNLRAGCGMIEETNYRPQNQQIS